MRKYILASLLLLAISVPPLAAYEADTLRSGAKPNVALLFHPMRVVKSDEYVKRWLKSSEAYRVAAEVSFPSPSGSLLSGPDTALFRQEMLDYGQPSLALGAAFFFNHGVHMHRDKDAAWGMLEPVDYTTHLSNAMALYGRFDRPLLRSARWEMGYSLGTGLAYSFEHYNNSNAIDNEFIGSHLNIFFTAGAYAEWKMTRGLALKAGMEFAHYSNGALARPNKGVNYLSPFVGVVGIAADKNDEEKTKMPATYYHFRPYWFLEFSLGAGGKTMLEDWQKAQFRTAPGEAGYRTNHYPFYGAFSLQTDILYRYKPRWASGVGVDIFYGDYADHIARLDAADGNMGEPHSPWSIGVAMKHEAFFGRLSARMGIGYYLYRHMGVSARAVEKRYYERIGLHYAFPGLDGLAIGFNVNAHATKADFTELEISLPVIISRRAE